MESASNDCVAEDRRGRASSASAYLRLVPSAPRAETDRSGWLKAMAQAASHFRERCDAGRLWLSLCSGRLQISDLTELNGQTVAILERRLTDGALRNAIPRRRLEVLERRLSGDSEKAIAIDLDLSGSTVCSHIRRALEAVSPDPRIPGLMMLLARVYHAATSDAPIDATFTRLTLAEPCFVVSLPQLELGDSRHLSPAEIEVCQLLLRGRTHDEIANLRGTRPRTVSNQIASIFQKFNVSGRMTLMTALIRG